MAVCPVCASPYTTLRVRRWKVDGRCGACGATWFEWDDQVHDVTPGSGSTGDGAGGIGTLVLGEPLAVVEPAG